MKNFPRNRRVADVVQKAIAHLLQQKAHDPRFQSVTITAVDVSRDLHQAKVCVTLREADEVDSILKALKNASGYFRSELAKDVILRSVPKLTFIYDKSVSHGHRISNLLNDIKLPKEEEGE